MNYSRKANEHRGSFTFFLEQLSPGKFRYRLPVYRAIGFKITMCTCASCVYYTLRNTFTVEMRNLFEELVIFQCRRTAITDCPQTLIVRYRMALPCSKKIFWASPFLAISVIHTIRL